MIKHTQRQKYTHTQIEKTEQTSEPDVVGILLELSDLELKTTNNYYAKGSIHKVSSIQEKMGNVTREMKI